MRKSWKQKLVGPRTDPYVCALEKPFGGFPAGATMLIPTPMLVKEFLDAIPRGVAKTVPQMRAELAQKFDADTTCPLTSGMFVRIAAEAALEDLAEGRSIEEVTPFWRVIDKKSPAINKLSCAPDFVFSHRKAEGLPE